MKAASSWHWTDRLGDEMGQFLHWLCYGVCSRRSRKKEMLVLGVILAFYLLSLQNIFITRTINLRFDGVAMYGGYHYFIEALLYNFLPLWNPYQHGGEPFYYGWSMLLVLNPSTLLFAVGAKILQPFVDLSLYDLYHYNYLVNMLLLWLGAYLLARRVLRHPLSVYIALMVMMFGSVTAWLLQANIYVGSLIWMPWVLYFLIRVMDNGKAFDLLALAYFAGITIGASNYHFVYSLFFGTVFVGTLLFTHRGRLWRPFIRQKKTTLLAAAALLLMMSAPLLSLWVDFDKIYPINRNVLREAGGLVGDSLSSKAVVYGDWSWVGNVIIDLGIIPTGLALIGAMAGRNRFKWNLLATFAITFLVFLGPKIPFFQIINDVFLPLRLQRMNVSFQPFLVLCLTLLAGIGVDALVSLVMRRTQGASPETTAEKSGAGGSTGRGWPIISGVGALTSTVKSHARRLLGIVVEEVLRHLPGAKNPQGQRRLILFGFSTIIGLLVLHWLGVWYSPLAVLLVLVATVSLTHIGEGALYRLPGVKSPQGQRRLILFGFSTTIGLLILYRQSAVYSPLNVLLVLVAAFSLTHVVYSIPWGRGRYVGALLIVLALWASGAIGPFGDSGTLILRLSLLVLGAAGIAYCTRNTRTDLGQMFLLMLALAVFVDMTLLSNGWASGRSLSLSPIKEELAFDAHASKPEFISGRIPRVPSSTRILDPQGQLHYQYYYQYYQFLPILSKRVTAVDGTLPLREGGEIPYVKAYSGREEILMIGWVWLKSYLQVYEIGERSLPTFENLMGLSGDRPILDFYPRAVVNSEDESAALMEKPYQELSPILDSAVVLSEHLDAPFQQLEVKSIDIKSVEAKPEFTYKVVSYNPNHIEVDVEVGSDGLLLFRDGYDDYWKATVDGMPQTVYKANVMFKAIPLKEGTHRVAFDYRPVFFLWALALYFMGNALFIAYLAYHSLPCFWPSKSAGHDSPEP